MGATKTNQVAGADGLTTRRGGYYKTNLTCNATVRSHTNVEDMRQCFIQQRVVPSNISIDAEERRYSLDLRNGIWTLERAKG